MWRTRRSAATTRIGLTPSTPIRRSAPNCGTRPVSIPTSILMSLIAITMAGFSLNVITMSALVLGVGMMVDNSIVVLESCFRATAEQEDKGALGYFSAALHGTGIVINSIIGSTITTCVVFLPLAFLNGMTGQMFKPLGFTIVFCMSASLLSAMTVVPLCYLFCTFIIRTCGKMSSICILYGLFLQN